MIYFSAMTLIISAITPHRVIQSSDRLLTNIHSGEPHPVPANKTFILVNQKLSLSISYTGTAFISKQATDEWLYDYLLGIINESLSLDDILKSISEHTTETFRLFSRFNKRITFALAGYENGYAFRAGVSNMEGEDGNYFDTKEEFITWKKYLVPKKKPVVIVIHGNELAANISIWKHIKSHARDILYQSDEEKCVDEIVNLIRAAGKTPKSGIGLDCVSVVIHPDRTHNTKYHPYTPQIKLIAPPIITPTISYKGIEVWTEKPPDWD